jgi:taurine dioxygenase
VDGGLTSSLKVTRVSKALGAEVRGFDLAEVDTGLSGEIEQLLWEHQVLFFPDQRPTPEVHVAFGAHFGRLEGHPHLKSPELGSDKIFELRASGGGVADEWHSDLTFQKEPSIYAILHMVACPEIGGDTMWANLYQVYDELSAPMKELCEGLSAIHSAEPHGLPDVMTSHPLVRVHPETGRKVLFVNEHFTRRIVEMSLAESDLLLGHLTSLPKQPRYSVRYPWSAGTVAMWDNRCTQHSVLNDFGEERIIQRVTIMGDQVEGPAARFEPFVRPSGRSDTSRHDRILRKFLKSQAST